MQVAAALICDFASVREGLLFVVGGGITRVWRREFPAPLNVALALLLEAHPTEANRPHEVDVIVQSEDGAAVAQLKGGFQISTNEGARAGEPALIPFVIDFRSVAVPKHGGYSVEILLDSTHMRSLPFQVAEPQDG